jgi:antirestriction protein
MKLWGWLELDESDRELLEVYQEHVDESGTIEQARDSYYGQYDSAVDWAAEFLDGCGDIPEHLAGYIDYAAYARDSEMIFARHEGSVWAFHR